MTNETAGGGDRAVEYHRTAIAMLTAYTAAVETGSTPRQLDEVLKVAQGDLTEREVIAGLLAAGHGLADMVAQSACNGSTVASVLQFLGSRAAQLGDR